MDTSVCPKCGTGVVEDGTCLSCGAVGEAPPVVANPFDADLVDDRPMTARTKEQLWSPPLEEGKPAANPYASPQSTDRVRYASRKSQPQGLGWILFSFQGRIPRRVYWSGSLVVTLLFYAYIFLIVVLFGDQDGDVDAIGAILLLASYPLMIWIQLALSVKRWHDRDKSGLFVLVGFIPIIGPIWQFVEAGCLRGTVGDNQYGPDPT